MTTDTAWEELPAPTDLPAAEVPPDKTEGDLPVCPVCGEVIIRDPSWKRMRKYHPGCVASAAKAPTRESKSRGSKAEKEADECSRILQAGLTKVALAVSVVDRYDAFCIMVNTPSTCSSFRAVCLRYPELRKEFLRVPEGGSVFSLVFSLAFMAAPIAARHGLIPSKRIADLLTNLPIALFKLQDRMRQGEEGLTTLMREHMQQMADERDSRRESSNGQYVGPTRSPG